MLNFLLFCFIFSGSGFMISGRRVLTNAHCVEHHTQVEFWVGDEIIGHMGFSFRLDFNVQSCS